MNAVQGGQEKDFVNNHFIYHGQSEIIKTKYNFLIGKHSGIQRSLCPIQKPSCS